MSQNGWVAFEQPLNERVRTFLRLETLFAQHAHHAADDSEWGLRATLHSLLDIMSVVSRSDLKVEIVKELSEQHDNLAQLAEKPGVDPQRLQSTLDGSSSARMRARRRGALDETTHPGTVFATFAIALTTTCITSSSS